jgi:LacI family transcriptional regulator
VTTAEDGKRAKKRSHPKRATSYDVAKLAGVSQTTVSFVINGLTNGISEETQARVHEAIAELHFQPHEVARNLARRASRRIGIVIPESNPHYYELVQGAKVYAQQHGYSISVHLTDFRLEEERDALQMLPRQLVDALIMVLWSGNALRQEIQDLIQQGYPIVNLGFFDDLGDTVVVEQSSGERQVIEHLAGLGHRRIGYIYGVGDQHVSTRLDACLAVQQGMGFPVHEQWICRCGPTQEDAYHACQDLLVRCANGQCPTALVVSNDWLTQSVYKALHEAQLVVPQDMSVVSFDNTPLATYMVPSLTSVNGETIRRGELAARLAIEHIADPKRPSQHLETHAQLIVRASTGPASS